MGGDKTPDGDLYFPVGVFPDFSGAIRRKRK
jgi:hypothetical protein